MTNHLRRADSEALVEGRPLTDDRADQSDDVEAFFTTLRNDYGKQAAPEPRPVLASILDGRRPLRTVAAPVATTPTRPASLLSWHRWPRPAAAALATGTLLFSGLAAAGALPAPVQRFSADVGSSLGVDIPRPSESPAPTRIAPPAGTTNGGRTGTPSSGAGRTGGDDRRPSSTSATTPSITSPLSGASGASGATGLLPTVPTTPSVSLPELHPGSRSLVPRLELPGLPAPLGSKRGGVVSDLLKVPRAEPIP